MPRVYHQQLLLSFELKARIKAEHFASIANDTLNSIFEKVARANIMILQNRIDDAEQLLQEALQQYYIYGYTQTGLQVSTILMHLYGDKPEKTAELKQLIRKYDSECELFNHQHELPSAYRLFYAYKGKLFENEGNLDSADYYFRKIYFPKMPYSMQNTMYKGLLNIYKKRNVGDSIAKYATLYCAANDSSISLKDQQLTANLTASYNYGRFQRTALEYERKTYFILICLILLTAFFVIIVVTMILKYLNSKKVELIKRNNLKREYHREKQQLQTKLNELQRLEENHQAVICEIRKELEGVHQQNTEIRLENSEYKNTIKVFNSQFEKEKKKLNDDIHELNDIIQVLQQKLALNKNLNMARMLKEMPFVELLDAKAKNPKGKMTKRELKQLEDLFASNFPDLLHLLLHTGKLTFVDRQIGMLTALGYDPSQLQRLLDLTPQQISNKKAKLNTLLFNDNSASTLYNNLMNKYPIYK